MITALTRGSDEEILKRRKILGIKLDIRDSERSTYLCMHVFLSLLGEFIHCSS